MARQLSEGQGIDDKVDRRDPSKKTHDKEEWELVPD
jgi:hypothetical protein